MPQLPLEHQEAPILEEAHHLQDPEQKQNMDTVIMETVTVHLNTNAITQAAAPVLIAFTETPQILLHTALLPVIPIIALAL